ncbi:MAG: glycosyltransferase [Acidobacteriota bacterium]
MNDLAVSVIIPTYGRMDTLPEVLDAVEAQDDAPPYELIVVDDGSPDDTPRYLRQRRFRVPAQVHSQANAGPAAARNRGVAAARADHVAFLGDDTVPSRGWLAAHLAARDRHARDADNDRPLAVIGYTGWHPRMTLDPFLRYINEYGLQFGYALIDEPADVPFNFFYTSNLSLPRRCLVDEPFDEGFPYPAWEDIECSYRLSKRGLRLVYAPTATTAHDHPTTLARFMARQEKAGFCATVFHARHPELGGFLGLGPDGPPPPPPIRLQQARERMARFLLSIGLSTPRLWEEVLRFHYIRGLHRGWAARPRGEDRP